MDISTENDSEVGDTNSENVSVAVGDKMTEDNTGDIDSSQNTLVAEGRKEDENDTEVDATRNNDAAEEHDADTSEEMINLPDTFFDDLMDVEFLGSFDVVDSWKQDEDTADGKSDGKGSEENEKGKSSVSGDKDRRTRDRGRSDRDSRYDSKRTRHNYRDNNRHRDLRDRDKLSDGKSRHNSRSRSERSRSRSKKESTLREKNSSRSRRDRSRSRSRKRSSSRQRKDRSNSRSKRDRRSNSRSKKERRSNSRSKRERRSNSRSKRDRRSNSRSRKERRSNSKSRNEKRSNSKSRNERRSNSRSRNERRSNSKSKNERRSNSKSRNERRSNSKSRNERRSNSKSRKERSNSMSRRDRRSNSKSRRERRSLSKSRKERSGSRLKKDGLVDVMQESNDKMNTPEIEGAGASQDVQTDKHYFDGGAKDRRQDNSRPENNLLMNDVSCLPSLKMSTEPAPPGLEEDLVPPGEEPILIKPNLEASDKDAYDNKQKVSEKINNKENYPLDKHLPINMQEKQSEEKSEPISSAKSREDNEYMKIRPGIDSRQRVMGSGRVYEEFPRNRERPWERTKEEFDDVSKKDIDPRYFRSHRTRSVSAEREHRDRSRYRETPIEADPSIERDIRHFKWLRMLEKREKERADRDPENGSRMRDFRERDDYYSHKQRHRSRSKSPRLSLSPISLSPVRSRYAYSRSRSRSRNRSRDYRRRRSSHHSSDSLRSLSLSSLSSDNSTRRRKYSRMSHRRSGNSKRKPFYEEIARKLGIPTNSSENVFPQQHHRPGGMQQPNIAYTGGPPRHLAPALPMPGYPGPPGPVVGPPLGPVADGPPNIHIPPPNLHLPPPLHHMMQPGPPPMMAGPPPPQAAPAPDSYPQPPFIGGPGPAPAPIPGPVVGPASQSLITITPQPFGAAPPEPVFSVQPETADPSSLSSYLEATMKGDAQVLQQQTPDKIVRKVGEDKKLLSVVKPEVVSRCEEAVAAVRAENALSMVPLGRVIVQPKAPGSSASCSTDQVSCFRSPLYDLSNPSFTFTTLPLHDFVSSNLRTAARKLRRSEQVKQLALRSARSNNSPGSKLGDAMRRPGVSVGVNTEISCNSSEWCCKCQAYNLSTAAPHGLDKQRQPSASNALSSKMESDSHYAGRIHPQPGSSGRNPTNSVAENSDDSDVQIVEGEAPVSTALPNTPKGILKKDNKPPEKTMPVQKSRNYSNMVVTKKPVHSFASFPNLAPVFKGMTSQQFSRFCDGFTESQRRYLESVANSNR